MPSSLAVLSERNGRWVCSGFFFMNSVDAARMPSPVSERVAQRSLLDMAEMVPAAAYEAHVASREAVDRLPVVADHEVRDAGVVEGPQQLHAARGYVLELVD